MRSVAVGHTVPSTDLKKCDYLNGKLTTITYKALMTSAKRKFEGAKYLANKKIMAMTAALNAFQDQLKLEPKLSTIADKGKKDNMR